MPDKRVRLRGGLTVLEEGTLVENKRVTALTSAELADRYRTLAELIGDVSMVERFLVQFRETFSNARAVFAGHVDAGDIESARNYTHQLKGVSGNLRMNDLFEQSKVVEDCLRDSGSSFATCEEPLEELLSLIETEILVIEQYLANSP